MMKFNLMKTVYLQNLKKKEYPPHIASTHLMSELCQNCFLMVRCVLNVVKIAKLVMQLRIDVQA